MKIYLSKRLLIPGDQEISCIAWSNMEGFVGVAEESSKIKVYKLTEVWEFYHPNKIGHEINEDIANFVCAGGTVADMPYCVYENDYMYKVHIDLFP